jgi:hypothetical protein
MSLVFGGTTVNNVIFNGTTIDRIVFNGVEVYTSKPATFFIGMVNLANTITNIVTKIMDIMILDASYRIMAMRVIQLAILVRNQELRILILMEYIFKIVQNHQIVDTVQE